MENNTEKKSPSIINVEIGTVAWCNCGLSKNYPYCDGSHKTTPDLPTIQQVYENKTVAICACGQSKNKPFCDGSHKSL